MKHLFMHETCKFSRVPEKFWFLYEGKMYMKVLFENNNAISYDLQWVKIDQKADVEWLLPINDAKLAQDLQNKRLKIQNMQISRN